MKTLRLYYEYGSGEPLTAEILEVRPRADAAVAVILDKTIFYPEGGGQSADRGTINGQPLLDVREQEGGIFHILQAAAPLRPGPAELRLDAKRRQDMTVQHTAQHLLSGTLLRLTGACTQSIHLGEERATIDVDAPELTPQTLLMAEEAVQDAIEEDAPLIIHHCPPERLEDFPLRKRPPQGEEVIRVVEIQGKDFSPCCGTHLRATGKIGMLRILGAEKYKGMTRIAFIAGRRVLRDSRLLRQNGELISRSLKIPVEETGKGVLALLEKLSTQEKRLKDLEEADALHEAAALIVRAGPGSGADVYQELFPHKTMEELLRIGRAAQKTIPHILVLAAAGELKFAAFTSRKDADIRPLLKTALEQCKGRGGGGPSFFQGSFSDPADLSAFLNALPKTLPQGTAD